MLAIATYRLGQLIQAVHRVGASNSYVSSEVETLLVETEALVGGDVDGDIYM